MAEAPPTDALYWQTKGALAFNEGRRLARIGEGESKARSEATRREGAYGRGEPLAYKANQERANRGGILESGINSRRRGTIAADYAAKRLATQEGLQESLNRFTRERKEA